MEIISLPKLRLLDKNEMRKAFLSFSKREWLYFSILAIVLVVSGLSILQTINKSFMVEIPSRGGEIVEGVIGSPRFINPVLAFADTDRDLVSLVYSGLMRKDGDGNLMPDLAEKYEISENGLTYTFTLKENMRFHDDTNLTTEDVRFTIEKVVDPVLKSLKRGGWEGVGVEVVDERTIKFNLKQAYGSFLENTTLGIIPKHIWAGSPLELNEHNTTPIGSGPFQVEKVNKGPTGITSYQLSAFEEFALGEPYVQKFNMFFYANEETLIEALRTGKVEQISQISPAATEELRAEDFRVEHIELPRVFGLFFNQSQNQLFTDKSIIRAINQAINKDRIIAEVLFGYGRAIESPIPEGILKGGQETASISHSGSLKTAEETLLKGGWKRNESGQMEKTTTKKSKKTVATLSFSISTSSDPELAKTAALIAEDLRALGMQVEVKTFEVGDLNQNIIRPREYETLLFGEIINNESDLYAFWHSSQRKDPGLNVALYTNTAVDKILEDAFRLINPEKRNAKYREFETEIKKDMPAVFLYNPSFIYVNKKELRGLDLSRLSISSDRFTNISKWHTNTENVWKIFAK